MNQILEARNLNETTGISLVIEVINIHVRYAKMAIVTGCDTIFLSTDMSYSMRAKNSPVSIIISASEGSDSPRLADSWLKVMAKGVLNAIRYITHSTLNIRRYAAATPAESKGTMNISLATQKALTATKATINAIIRSCLFLAFTPGR